MAQFVHQSLLKVARDSNYMWLNYSTESKTDLNDSLMKQLLGQKTHWVMAFLWLSGAALRPSFPLRSCLKRSSIEQIWKPLGCQSCVWLGISCNRMWTTRGAFAGNIEKARQHILIHFDGGAWILHDRANKWHDSVGLFCLLCVMVVVSSLWFSRVTLCLSMEDLVNVSSLYVSVGMLNTEHYIAMKHQKP